MLCPQRPCLEEVTDDGRIVLNVRAQAHDLEGMAGDVEAEEKLLAALREVARRFNAGMSVSLTSEGYDYRAELPYTVTLILAAGSDARVELDQPRESPAGTEAEMVRLFLANILSPSRR